MKRGKSSVATVVRLSPKREAQSLELGDGAVATAVDGALELRDSEGRLLVRYADGSAEIAAPSGDLVLSAPSGRVVVRSALDVELCAARDVVQHAGRKVEFAAGRAEPQLRIEPRKTSITSDRIVVETNDAKVVAGTIATVARAVATTAETIALAADKYELNATCLFEKSRDAFREVADLAQTRAGRMRSVVSTIFTLNARRTVLVSKEETSIDGRKILLG